MQYFLGRRTAASIAAAAAIAGVALVPSAASASPTARTSHGVTVSWPATTAPVVAIPGKTTHSRFWVTNPTRQAVPVTVGVASAIPGNNGALAVQPGTNAEFPTVSYAPSRFVLRPGQTTQVSVTTSVRKGLGPGVYLLPARVVPHPPAGTGNIRIVQSVVALVTFEVPGATNAEMSATFVSPPAKEDVAPIHRVGALSIELASSGSAVLEVLDESGTSVFAYTETTATQAPFGEVVLAGHTPGQVNDVRTAAALYFGGHYRDFPLSWHASPLGLGLASVHGYVTYQPGPGRVRYTSAATRVLVVSPWWEFLPWALVLLVALVVARRIRRRRKLPPAEDRSSAARVIGRTLTSAVVLALLALPALAAQPLALSACAPAVVLALYALTTRRRRPAHGAVFIAHILTATFLAASAAGIVLSALLLLPADLPLGVVVAAGTTALATWWTSWSIRPRKSPRHLRGGSQMPEPAGVGG